MTRALQNLLQRNRGRDVMAFRQGPFRLYLWNAKTGEHESYDPFYSPPAPRKPFYSQNNQENMTARRAYKDAVAARCTFLNRKKQAKRESF